MPIGDHHSLFGDHYSMCQCYRGRAVEITTHDGMTFRGVIMEVDRERVFLQPLGYSRNFGGFSYGWYGNPGSVYLGPGPGFGAGIALGAIATLFLLPLFFI